MSSFSCQEGLRAVDVQTPGTASRMDDQKSGAELWEFCDEGRPTFREAQIWCIMLIIMW